MDERMPVCTVCLITFNHAKYVAQAIESVLTQKTQYPFVIKIFDDASTDGSSDIIRAYAAQHPDKIKAYIAKSNQGAQANIWRAFLAVKTKYFCLLETDDYWCDDYRLERQINNMEKHPECSFCCGNTITKVIKDDVLYFLDEQKTIRDGLFKKSVISWDDLLKIRIGYITHNSSRLFRTEALDLKNVKNKESVVYDIALFYFMFSKGNMYWDDHIVSVYRKTGTGISSGQSIAKRMHAFLKAMIDLNEDTKGVLWNKIYSHITITLDYYSSINKKIANNFSKKCCSNRWVSVLGFPVIKVMAMKNYYGLCFLGIPLFKAKNKGNINRYYILGMELVRKKKTENKTIIRFLGLPILKIKKK